ncbi:hypothetical protein M8C21_000072, partial [Ambrosia artemisiifolia]
TTFPTSSDPTMSKGMPSTFHNLIEINVEKRDVGTTIIPSNALPQLEKLQQITLVECGGVEEIDVIVKEEEEEEECDAKVNEIMLPRLRSLKLDGLLSFKGFCLGKEAFSFPALDTLKIKGCPDITVFTKGHLSTPKLEEIDTSFGMCDVKTDLNSFIETKQEEILDNEDHMFYVQGFVSCLIRFCQLRVLFCLVSTAKNIQTEETEAPTEGNSGNRLGEKLDKSKIREMKNDTGPSRPDVSWHKYRCSPLFRRLNGTAQ